MAKLRSLFTNGVMEKDLDRSLVPNGSTRNVENLRFHINDGKDGIGTNIKGTLIVSDETKGANFKCVGGYFDESKNLVYYLLATFNRVSSKIVEYDVINNISTVIIEDDISILRFNYNGYVTGVNELNGLLLISEWTNNPRRINIERAKEYGLNGFTEEDIMVAVIPPHQKLRISLNDTVTGQGVENNIEEKFLSFSYRYRYLDGEYSALAPFTNAAFQPKSFDYDFTEQSNKSMVNKFNQVQIEFFTGNKNVTEIQLIYKESQSSTEWIIDDFNKEDLEYEDNDIETFLFDNSKVYRALPDNVLKSYFDNVPREVKAQTMIEGRLIYAHYKEQYDLKNIDGVNINIDYNLILESLENTIDVQEDELDADGDPTGNQTTVQKPSLEPKKTVRSNRDVEIGLVYSDEHGRSTTVLVSKTNTIMIPASASDTENKIKVELRHKPPFWAKYYRFFVTQNKKGYDQFLPTLFYQEGVYRYIKVEQSDIDKFKEGDFVIVKADGEGILNTLEKIKVLEFERKDKDFLNDQDGGQPSGWYMKISLIDSDVTFDESNYSFTKYDHYDASGGGLGPVTQNNQSFYKIKFKNSGVDTLTPTVTFNGTEDLRYEIEIHDVSTTPNVFRFRTQQTNGVTPPSVWTELDTDTSDVVLDSDVSVRFAATTGNSLNDKWLLKKSIAFLLDQDNRSHAIFSVPNFINAGSTIKLKYFSAKERSNTSRSFLIEVKSNQKYDNIEEWFYGDEIFSLIQSQPNFDWSEQNFWFREVDLRYSTGNSANRDKLFIDVNPQGISHSLIIASDRRKENTRNIYSDVFSEIRQIRNIPIFETEPKDQSPEIFFEIGKTYRVIDNLHSKITDDYETDIENISTDISQSLPSQPLVITLDWFNAWSYGNGVESYKIKDEFNKKGLDVGIRVLSNTKDRYREITRVADVQWSDIYNDDSDFNGLNWFNLSAPNYVLLDKENGSIQLIDNDNGNLLILQESAIGTMPYNKQVIYDASGNQTIGVVNNVLDERSWRPYAGGEHGISLHPESYVKIEGRKYFTDQQRGNIIQLANDGVTTINQYGLEYEISNAMANNKSTKLVAGYDFKHKEYVVHIPNKQSCLAYKLTRNGFPNYFMFEPDFMLNANNEFYAWKNGVMYRMNATENYNEFFGVQSMSKINFFENTEPSTVKICNSMAIQSNKPWDAFIKTRLTSVLIPKEHFEKYEDYFYAAIMGNTNSEPLSNSSFGLGSYEIVNGLINCSQGVPSSLSVGDTVSSISLGFAASVITSVINNQITIANTSLNESISFLKYNKNQSIEGQSIRGDVLDIELTYIGSEYVEIRAVDVEAIESKI
jgi:hypothetical protein